MPTTDLSYIIDPGGSVISPTITRPGINLQVFPSGQTPQDVAFESTLDRTATADLVLGGFADLADFEFQTTLAGSDYNTLKALLTWSEQSRKSLSPSEIVIYNLAEPYSELGTARTRFIVPGTSIIAQEELATGYYRWTYWVALQGNLSFTNVIQQGSHFQCGLAFTEGTKLTPDMES